MRDGIVILLLLAGAFFALTAAVGILRMPDLFTRMHAAAKAGTVGIGFIFAASVVHFGSLHVFLNAILVFFFLLLTTPVAMHMIARAAYFSGEPLWKGKGPIIDELKDYYKLGEGQGSSRERLD